MTLFKAQTWTRAALLALPVAVAPIAVSQLQSDLGLQPMSAAFAQEENQPKKERETRRTPALRNKVYEKLAEAQAAAEAKDLNQAAKVLDGMIASGGKNALNSYELANVYNLYAFIHYSREDYAKALKAYGFADHQLITDELGRLTHGTDAGFYRLMPQIVVMVENEAQVRTLIGECAERQLPLTFRAAGTSLSGQAVSDSVESADPQGARGNL